MAAAVCPSLREAAESSSAPYFFEQLLAFGRQPIPYGPEYETWRAEREAAMEHGDEMRYCGAPWTTDPATP